MIVLMSQFQYLKKQFYDMVNNIRNLEKIISTPDFGIKDIEKGTVASRRIS